MINPSINGWITKYFLDFDSNKIENDTLFYDKLRNSGIVYGNIVDIFNYKLDFENELTDVELSKIVYLDVLHEFFLLNNKSIDKDVFIAKANEFFEQINPQKENLLGKMLPKNTAYLTLENTIDNRIYINENALSKKFSNLVMNAFLFIDILAFHKFLIKNNIPENYLSTIEQSIIKVITIAIKSKTAKSTHDELLIKLFENSLRYSNFSEIKLSSLDEINFNVFETNFEKKYLLDLTSLAIWSDKEIENNEIYFLQKLAEKLKLNDELASDSINKTANFIDKNKSRIALFNNSNPVKSFYDQTSQSVVKLILRNKKRLGREISQSKELMKLLALAAKRDLDDDEKIRVRKQLLDICKTVPSLTIFLIPGGSLLLPILIKFIPQLLPSAFNENLEDE